MLLATTTPGLRLMGLVVAAGHMVVKENVALTWPRLMRTVGEALEPGFRAVLEALDPESVKDDDIDAKLLEGLKEAIEHARELEAIVEEAKVPKSGDVAS